MMIPRSRSVPISRGSPSSGVDELLQSRMTYASSRETLKNALNGIALNWQANEPGELEWADLLKEASKGKTTV